MRRVDAETSGGRKMFEEMGVLLAQKLEVCRRCKNKRLNRLMSEEFIGAKHPISPSPPSPTPSPHRYFYLNQGTLSLKVKSNSLKGKKETHHKAYFEGKPQEIIATFVVLLYRWKQ
ncbi:uncharacterized protein LOC120090251 isoform X2 [Benincasa hispida]|uniref:uncharacterized protein LOC120090251 isoform X2 n=1 Tax=Benincasa hispida TaxID=102211 RepID=UPI001901BB8F|nr:uncharacterized protein LOC120090251 isoform X2 [Benincasa hispida]